MLAHSAFIDSADVVEMRRRGITVAPTLVSFAQSGDSSPAAALGIGDSIGVLAPGKLANLVAVRGNPLADLSVPRPGAVGNESRQGDRPMMLGGHRGRPCESP